MTLRKGWEVKKFNDVLNIRNGRNQRDVKSETGAYPILGSAGNVMGYANSYICEAGTTIIGRKGNISNPIYVNTPFWNVDTAFGLSPKTGLHHKFLYFYCLNYDFAALNRGTTIPSLVKTELLEITIPIPPLPEQQRIVDILDEAFAGIDTAIANTQQAISNAKELFDTELNRIFSQRGEGWEVKTIKELTTVLGDGLHGTPKYTNNGEYYFINGNNLTDGLIELKENTKRVSVDEYNKYKKNLTDRTVLVSINGTLGNVAFYNGENIILGKSACYFNLKDNINKHFVKYVLTSPYFLKYAHKEATGATIKNVSLKTMREFIVSFPDSIHEQQRIVAKLDSLKEQTQALTDVYQQKLAALQELKQSLLHKAFTGELTANW
jgi:type I restriction enzyme S subunit